MKLFELHSIWTERVCLRACGDTSGPVVTTWVGDCQGNEAAREGITRGSEDGDAGADRQAQQGAATDARAASQEGDRIAVWVCFAVEACCQSIAAYFGWGTSVLDLAGNKIKALPIPPAGSRPAEGCAPASRDRCPPREDW